MQDMDLQRVRSEALQAWKRGDFETLIRLYFQALADSPNRSALQRLVSRNWRLRALRRIDPDVVAAAVVVEESAVCAQVALEIAAVHAERRRDEASRRKSLTREARSARNASVAIRNASSIDSASVTSSGSSGLVTTNPPSAAGVSVRTSLPFDAV